SRQDQARCANRPNYRKQCCKGSQIFRCAKGHNWSFGAIWVYKLRKLGDYNETHYAEVYPAIITWANAKRAEWIVEYANWHALNDSGAGAIIDIGDEPAEFNASAYLTNQFNPFVKENTPPMITNVVIDTKESWGWSWGVWHCEHAWAEIDVSILDVAPYNLWIGVTDRGTYLFFSGTGGQYAQVHHAVIDLDYWEDVFAEYYVNVSAWDTANNIAYFEKEVAGFFGGVMNFLEDVWNGIVGVFSAAWEAVKAAMTWILDYIKGIIMGAINGFINWIQTMIKNAISGIVNAMIQSWKALGGANLNDLTSSLLLFPLVIGAALTSGKTLINNIKNAL
ncbi:MAG: hypothetical protein Q7J68_04195, partial [Thermoplasmata archaeon]|nr:hypothetical protein [Thermoplasmata archaeon]